MLLTSQRLRLRKANKEPFIKYDRFLRKQYRCGYMENSFYWSDFTNVSRFKFKSGNKFIKPLMKPIHIKGLMLY